MGDSVQVPKKLGYKCNLKNPITFNEKINWLKLHDRNPIYPIITDKIRAKKIAEQVIGKDHVIPTIAGGFSSFDEIPFDSLPNKFVIKCNHDSHSTIICKDKYSFDKSSARNKLKKALKRNYYHWDGKEWGYKGIKPQVFVEQYMEDGENTDLRDYKFFIFNGICKFIFTFDNRFSDSGVRSNCYTPEWDKIPLVWGRRANTEYLIEKPANLDEMLEIATKLAIFLNNPFIRVDLYSIQEKVYFGEYTLYPGGGLHTFEPFKWDVIFGEQLHIASD